MNATKNMANGPQPHEVRTRRLEELDLERVVERALGHEGEALAEIYQRYVRRVFGLCRYMLDSRESAEDATSEVFLKLQRSIETYDASTPFVSWLLRVASNQCIDMLRSRRRGRKVIAELDGDNASEATSSEPSPLGALLGKEMRGQVRDTIARLPEHYRVPLVLRYYSEMSYDEIAQQLDLTRNHVATLIFRAKQELRRRLTHRSE